jgi:hypothetical protein
MEDSMKKLDLRVKYFIGVVQCDGVMIPQFILLMNGSRFRFLGYCAECGQVLCMDFHMAELEKLCPYAGEPDTCIEIKEDPFMKILENFQPSPESKPS